MQHSPVLTPLLQHTPVMSAALDEQPDLTVSIGCPQSGTQHAPYYEAAHPIKGHVDVGAGATIYHEVHGLPPGGSLQQLQHVPKVVMLMGLACPCSAWRWQLQDLVQQHQIVPNYEGSAGAQQQQQQQQQSTVRSNLQDNMPQPQQAGLVAADTPQAIEQQQQWHTEHVQRRQHDTTRQQLLVCIIDNRGVGRSSSPKTPEAYSTSIMAQDVVAVMDHLQWQTAHVLGFSMGGMIAQRLAVAAPSRVQSLTLLSTSVGGWQIVPKHSLSGLKAAFKMVTARTPEDAVDATLHFHFRRRTLRTMVSHMGRPCRRKELLRHEYMTPDCNTPPQPQHGFKGQLRACWRHSLSNQDAQAIMTAGFPVLVIHGRSDKLASPANAEALARRLGAPCVVLPGAHFIVRECAGQINILLTSLVLGQQHITSVINEAYMDPSPSLRESWQQLQQQLGGYKTAELKHEECHSQEGVTVTVESACRPHHC